MSQDRRRRGVRSPWRGLSQAVGRLALESLVFLAPAAVVAQDFVDFATMSPTAPVVRQRLCYTDGVDVACDGAAGQVTTSGTLQIPSLSANTIGVVNISATGNIQANQFIGDGSGLTGVVASTGDRVVSGTTSLVAVSATGYVSLTQGGTNTGWFDPTRGLVTLGVSATGGISGTTGYFSGRVGLGTTSPSSTLHIFGITGTPSTGLAIGQVGNYTSIYPIGGLSTQLLLQTTGGVFNIGGGVQTGWVSIGASGLSIGGNTVAATISSTLTVSGTGMITSWTTIGARVTATNALDVYGTISATGVSVTGIVSATRFVGDGSGLTGVVAASSDRITSGTTSFVVVSDTGYISLTQGGTNTGWFDPTRGLVTLGVSATGPVSATALFISAGAVVRNNLTVDTNTFFVNATNNRVGIGTILQSETLHVSGTARVTSWTSIGADMTAGAPLDVYGTVSATEVKVGAGTTAGNSCNTSQFGTIRRNPTTGRIQVCRPL